MNGRPFGKDRVQRYGLMLCFAAHVRPTSLNRSTSRFSFDAICTLSHFQNFIIIVNENLDSTIGLNLIVEQLISVSVRIAWRLECILGIVMSFECDDHQISAAEPAIDMLIFKGFRFDPDSERGRWLAVGNQTENVLRTEDGHDQKSGYCY